MVPEIGDLISESFYSGELKSAANLWDPTFQHVLPKPVTWLTTASLLNRSEIPSGLSSFNNPSDSSIATSSSKFLTCVEINSDRTEQILADYHLAPSFRTRNCSTGLQLIAVNIPSSDYSDVHNR